MGWLVADIGGTNTRCALARPDGTLDHVASFRNRDYPALEKLLAAWLARIPAGEHPDEAVLGIAAPISGDQIHMINIDWTVSVQALARTLSLKRVVPLNDFAAQAYALPSLQPEDLAQVGGGKAMADAPRIVLGPGTGLGTAGLLRLEGRWHAVPGEGGHVTMAASDERESQLIARARERYGHCSAERLLSGAGLSFLYEALGGGAGMAPEVIGSRIVAGEPAAREALHAFFRLLGTFAGNLALTFGAFGGVYIGGGITPRYLDELRQSGFRARFEAKGRYRHFLEAVPTWVITADQSALRGLAAYAIAGAGRR